jgi:hypothetical protein
MKLFLGHDPSVDLDGYPGEGVDLLLTIYDADETTVGESLELAVRPGKDQRGRTWGPPALLKPEALWPAVLPEATS